MRKCLFLISIILNFAICYSQDSSEIKQIDSIVYSISSMNLKIYTDTGTATYNQNDPTFITIKCYYKEPNVLYYLRYEKRGLSYDSTGQKFPFKDNLIFYYSDTALIKFEEEVEFKDKKLHNNIYYENGKSIFKDLAFNDDDIKMYYLFGTSFYQTFLKKIEK